MIWTDEHAANLKDYLETHTLPSGLGNKESACSIAAINLAISGELTDKIPDCMSMALGKAIIELQDDMPDDMRNSVRYRAMLTQAPGTERDKEEKRLALLMDWMWGTVLPQVQTVADKDGFGDQWRTMCEQRTSDAAEAARYAAARYARYAADHAVASHAARAADAATYSADAAAYAAAYSAAAYRATAAAYAARAACYAAAYAARDDFWQTIDPIGVLERMIEV